MRALAIIPFVFAAQMAQADGFAVTDLRQVTVDEGAFAGGTYDSLQEVDRIILACETCDDLTSVLVQRGTSTDGTEERFRSGQTTIAKMRSICQARDPGCTLTRLDLGGAVGWVTQYTLGATEGSTAVLFKDGDLLTIRATSDSRNRTGSNMATAVETLAKQIVGVK